MNQIDTTELVKRLTKYRDAYYNGTPIVTDAVFDSLEDELRRIDPQNVYFNKIGAPVPVNGAWPKVRHTIPMTSQNKAQNLDDFKDWMKSCNVQPSDILSVSVKCDGASVAMEYLNRRLVSGVTRGDGNEGEAITRNVLLMHGAVKMLPATLLDGTPTPDKVYVRGEMVILKSDFAKYFKGESNPRNSANGTAKRQTGFEKCQHETILTYQIMPNGSAMVDKETEFATLRHCGFLTADVKFVPGTLSQVDVIYQDYIAKTREATDHELDGLVIELNDKAKREALGDSGGNPKGSIALKFPREEKETTLRNVRWQVGNSGRVTPVAEFDVVTLVGAQVKQASLYNITYMEELVKDAGGVGYLTSGSKVLCARAGDVIPRIESVIFIATSSPIEFRPPTHCPECNHPLTREGEYLVCRGLDCPAQATGSIKTWVKKIEVLHVGDSLIEALVESGMVEDPADLYTLNAADVSDLEIGGRKVGATADKAIKNLKAKMTLPIHVLVGSLGIPLIGRDMAKIIADAGYDTLSKMAKATIPQIAAIPGLGNTKAEAFVNGYTAKLGLICKLIGNGITVAVASGPLVGKSFCMTGFRDGSLSAAIEAAGGTMKGNVSRGLTFLIALDKNGNSGKLASARANGTTVIDIDEAWAMTGQPKP